MIILKISIYNIIIISLFAHSETLIVSIEHSKTNSKYKYNTTIYYSLAISTLGRLILLIYIHHHLIMLHMTINHRESHIIQ